MKLIEVELSMTGLSRRKGILNKIESVLKKDWGSLEDINKRNLSPKRHNLYSEKLDSLKQQYEDLK